MKESANSTACRGCSRLESSPPLPPEDFCFAIFVSVSSSLYVAAVWSLGSLPLLLPGMLLSGCGDDGSTLTVNCWLFEVGVQNECV